LSTQIRRSVHSICAGLGLVVWGAHGSVLLGCKVADENPLSETQDAAAEVSLTAPSFRDDTPGTLLVWVREDGDFQTTSKVSDVPGGRRSVVRVIFDKQSPSSSEVVWVANLNDKRPDGSYATKSLNRKDWESRGIELRRVRVDAQKPKSPDAQAVAATGLQAIVYGADWCKPCHMAEDYLKQHGVQVTKKDIEEDSQAHAEMRQKLKAAGLGGASIPVLDVAGTLLVGFSPTAVDTALRRAAAKP